MGLAALGAEVRTGIELRQFGDRVVADAAPAVGGARQSGIVDHHQHAVARQLHVELDRSGAERHRLAQRLHRVLRCKRAVAGMADHRPRKGVEQDHRGTPRRRAGCGGRISGKRQPQIVVVAKKFTRSETCPHPWDYVPVRSWPLLRTRSIMLELIAPFTQGERKH
nr:hypothetical protein [Luteitalea sp.]